MILLSVIVQCTKLIKWLNLLSIGNLNQFAHLILSILLVILTIRFVKVNKDRFKICLLARVTHKNHENWDPQNIIVSAISAFKSLKVRNSLLNTIYSFSPLWPAHFIMYWILIIWVRYHISCIYNSRFILSTSVIKEHSYFQGFGFIQVPWF